MTMKLSKRVNLRTLIFVLLPVAVASIIAAWDVQRLDQDFNQIYALLSNARLDALNKRTIIIVCFSGDRVIISDQKDSKIITTTIPMLAGVKYDTTVGKDMIVYDWQGTSAYNKRVHGGEIMLKSLLGFRRYIHVNRNGVVREGRYPEDA